MTESCSFRTLEGVTITLREDPEEIGYWYVTAVAADGRTIFKDQRNRMSDQTEAQLFAYADAQELLEGSSEKVPARH